MDKVEVLEGALANLPRFRLTGGETALHELPRLSREVGCSIYVKRDDLTGLAFGGNKVRQAEYFVGAALASGADIIVAGGGYAQSNHARVLAAAARAAGLDSLILVRPNDAARNTSGGNAIVTRLVASEVRVVDALAGAPIGDRLEELEYRRIVFEDVAEELRSQGRTPFVVLGSSTALGVMGYVSAAIELRRQIDVLGQSFSKIFVTSLGATHAGLLLGMSLLEVETDVVGVAYQPVSVGHAEAAIRALVDAGASLIKHPGGGRGAQVRTEPGFAGSAYRAVTAEAEKARRRVAESDALILDPIYTAKGFAAMLQWIDDGRVERGERVLFIHTGGLPALFEVAAVGSEPR